MNSQTFYIIMTAVITLLFTTLLGGMILVMYIGSRQKKLKDNPIDIDVFEFNKTGCVLRKELGRKHFHEDYGWCIITAGRGKQIKEYISNTISDNELIPRKSTGIFNKSRKYLAVAVKDGVFASLSMVDKPDTEKLSKEQFQILQSYVTQIEISENPSYFSLNPIKAEQTRFVLDLNKELQEKYLNDDNIEMAKKLMKGAITVFVIGVIVILIMFIVLMSQGGTLVNALPKTPLPPG